QNWGTSQEQQVRAQVLDDFHREHLRPISSVEVGCNFCSYVAQGDSLQFDADESEDEDSDEGISTSIWGLACDHLDNVHHREMIKFMNENLPAWIEAHDGLPGSTRGKVAKKP